MPKIDIDRLCRDFEACIGWPYKSPGTNDERGIDCSGMFVRGYRLQGASIYHGSNTIWRKHLGEKGQITSAADLKKGMAIFKWRPEGGRYQDGQGNFQHIGLVTSTNPLRIVHASTVGMKVTVDSRIGKWKYWGYLLDGNYGSASTAPVQPAVTPAPAVIPSPVLSPVSYAVPAGKLTLKRGMRGENVRLLQALLAKNGFPVQVDGIFGKETLAAVRAFQRSRNITVDGVVGKNTWAQLGEL